MSQRPVYVPKGKRRQRLHGAFTGGFSAGYFNTVALPEGWTPQTEDAQQQQQRPEDFMDEQDHNEWGGPVALHQAYQAPQDERPADKSASDDLWKVQSPAAVNMGQRLLRVLGWREGTESAFVPSEQRFAGMGGEQQDDDAEGLHLSKRRLRKIRLQQQRVQIPQPKLDTAGLGFEPFENAPEFKAHRDKRRKMAQQRAQANSHQVYRVSHVLGGENDDEQVDSSRASAPSNHEPYVSFETVEDFVGSKSVGGFALREDDDDVYDDQPLEKVSDKVKFDRDAYDTVVYEHDSDDQEEDHRSSERKEQKVSAGFGSVLSSWASATASTNTDQAARTADGRPPLPGFILGGIDSVSKQTRFRGPDVPTGYTVHRHHFADDEHPLVIKALSHAEQLIADDQKKETAIQEALESNAAANAPLRTNAIFASVGSAMKNRFTSESKAVVDKEPPRVAGLSLPTLDKPPEASTKTADPGLENKQEPKATATTITRTVLAFAPEPLLCKRFHVSVPASNSNLAVKQSVDSRSREEAYFYDEIMAKAAAAAPAQNEPKKAEMDQVNKMQQVATPNRPPMEMYKSIYDPQSGDSSESDNEESANAKDEIGQAGLQSTSAAVSTSQQGVAALNAGEETMREDRLVPFEEGRLKKENGHETSLHHETRSPSNGSSDESDDSRRRRKRKRSKRKEERKRKHRKGERKRSKKRKRSSKHE